MNIKMNPLISIVIPTRERADTLQFTLKTALEQKTRDYEIIVSDNFSQDHTKQVVENLTDERVTYVNTGKRLSMCDNWDFGLSHARGKYIIIIGDDDGVMPGAIDRLKDFIGKHPSKIYYWQTHEYFWPIGDVPPSVTNIVHKRSPYVMNLKRLSLFAVRWGGWRYGSLPLLYHSSVSKEILDTIRQRTGRVFHSTNPDVFMAFALPAFTDTAINVGESITVNGRSAKSNSGNFIAKDGATVFQKFVDEYGEYRMHSSLDPAAPFAVNMIADTVLVAMELFPELYGKTKFNYTAMWAYIDRISFFKDSSDTIKRRYEIRQHHPFSVPRFIAYSLIHKLFAFRRFVLGSRLNNEEVHYPSNIQDFVQLLAGHKSSLAD